MTEKQWSPKEKEVAKAFNLAIRRGELDAMEEFLSQNPWLKTDRNWVGKTWFRGAITFDQLASVEKLIGLGFNVNSGDDDGATPLRMAVFNGNEAIARLLIGNGANPDLDKAILTALNNADPEERLKFLSILVEAGADVNQVFTMFGDEDAKFTALDRMDPDDAESQEVIQYLRNHGAKKFEELG